MIYKTNSGYGVNFNQIVENGDFVDSTKWRGKNATISVSNGVCTFTANAQWGGLRHYSLIPITAGHRYIIKCDLKATTAGSNMFINLEGSVNLSLSDGYIPLTTDWQTYTYRSVAFSAGGDFYLVFGDRRSADRDAFQVKNVYLTDITQDFGAGNEPTTVEEFREMYPDDYYDYTLSQWQWAKKGKITSYPTPVIENGTTLLPIENHIVGLAHYNDGNTDIIYNYAKRELPVGFVRLDYIESTGTQWIDTGLTSFCDFEIMSQVSEGQPNKTFGNYLACLERRSAANPYWQLLFSQGETVYSSVSVYNKTKNSLRNGVWKVNDETVATLDFDYYRGNFAYLFAVDTATFYPQKIFYLKTWDKQGNMTRNFIPCYRFSDGIEGLYDTVGKQFYTNQGTGRFIRGNIINGGILNNGN